MIRFCIALLVVGHGRALQFISKTGRIDPAWIKCRRLRQPSGPNTCFIQGPVFAYIVSQPAPAYRCLLPRLKV